MTDHNRRREIAVPAGDSWSDLARGRKIPDHHIARILTFLGSTAQEDLVHTPYAGAGHGLFDDMEEVVEQLVLVGTDGAGRRLRRRRFEVTADELIRDVDAIYLCEMALDDAGAIRYVVLDIRPGDDETRGAYEAVLMCRRSDFATVHGHLGIGGSGGAVWRGAAVEDKDPILAVDARDFTFDTDLLKQLRFEVVDFLQGEAAVRLRDWGVPAKRGIVLWGDPGNGKTVLTRLCAKQALEAGMNVVIIEGRRRSSLSYDRRTMGLGDELRRAAARSPALLIFEDIDLHCERRGQADGRAPALLADQEQPLAELLDFLDGVEVTDGYVLLASTNNLDSLDPGLRRPGRIDLEIEIGKPTYDQRIDALTRMVKLGPKPPPDSERVAEFLEGVSFADLAEIARRYKIAAASVGDWEPQQLLADAAEAFVRERNRVAQEGSDPSA